MTGSAMGPGWGSLLWFVLILAAIPLALWLLKRTPLGAGSGTAVGRVVGTLPLSPTQRVVTIEVGTGEQRRWLLLGVTPQGIATLHEMAPQADAPGTPPAGATPFAAVLERLKGPR